jgi:hypothetical protein
LVARMAPSDEQSRLTQMAQLEVQPWGTLETVLMLVHIAADSAGSGASQESSSEDLIGGLPEELAMGLFCSGMAVRGENYGNMIARTRLLFHEYGNDPRCGRLRKPPLELAREALGMDLDDALAIAFAYYAVGRGLEPFGTKMLMSRAIVGGIETSRWDHFLSMFAQDATELSDAAQTSTGDWQALPIQARPLLCVGDKVVLLDERFLIERVTRGVYWIIHDYEKQNHGNSARERWATAFGYMHEGLVEDYLRPFAPRILGGGSTFFTEEDLAVAFSGKIADIGIDFGGTVLIADAQAGQLSTAARLDGDVAAFRRDMERIIVNKAVQLDETAASLLTDPQPPGSPLSAPPSRIVSVVVPGGVFHTNPVTVRYMGEQLRDRGIYADPRARPPVVLDLRDLEHAQLIARFKSQTLIQLIDAWQASAYSEVSLSDWLGVQYKVTDDELSREDLLTTPLDASFEEIRLRLEPETTPEEWMSDQDEQPET